MTYIMRYEHSAVCTLSESRKAMKHDGGWQTKEFVYPMKRLVNGDNYAKSYPFEPTIYSLAICYRIVLHMKLSFEVGRNCRIITKQCHCL